MAWGKTDTANSAPTYITEIKNGDTGIEQYGNTIFAVDAVEAQVTNGPASPGWVRVTSKGSRKIYETLVAIRSMGADANVSNGADDAVFPNT